MVHRRSVAVLAFGLSLVGGFIATAQTPSAQTTPDSVTPNQRAMAAGYKALTVCSALFTAREAGGERTQASVEAHELTGIYPELEALVAAQRIEIGESDVTAAWDAAAPPRRAVYTPGRGCMILPTGYAGGLPDRAPLTRRTSAAPLLAGSPRGDAERLEAAIGKAFETGYGVGSVTTGVVVLQGGRIVAERYAAGFGSDVPQRTWSVGKSLAGTVIGAAVLRGQADVNRPAAIANWAGEGDPRGAITLDALMRMASGLTSDTAGNRTDALYFGGTAIDEQAPGWPMIAPVGTRYRYANNDTLLAVMSVSSTFAAHPPHELFDRLGMTSTWAETDWRGGYVMSSQVWTTARDLARFGQLYLQDGVWEGERLLPEGWRTYVTTPSGPQPPSGPYGYGATFWLLNRSDGVPVDTFGAFGNRGQYVIISPSRDVVIVRRGEDPTGKPFDQAAFARDVLKALE